MSQELPPITWSNDTRQLGDLIPWAQNPKTLTAEIAEHIKISVRKFGLALPLLISPNNDIYDGHQRQTILAAMEAYGPYAEVDVRVSSRPLTDDERRELVMRLRENQADWDLGQVASLYDLNELTEWGFDGLDELAAYLPASDNTASNGGGGDGEPAIDRAAELQTRWQVASGQLWQLGEHRVICGDCRETAVLQRLLGNDLVHGVFTSPPYAEQRKHTYGGIPADGYVAWFAGVQSAIRPFLVANGSFFLNIKAHSENGERVLYVLDLVLAMKRQWGWCYVDELSWMRQGLPGKYLNRFKNGFEPVHHFSLVPEVQFFPEAVAKPFSEKSRTGGKRYKTKNTDHDWHLWNNVSADGLDGALPSNVLNFPTGITAEITGAYHGATFPPDLPEFFIKAFSKPGDTWLDPFLGSGSTLIASHQNGRRCHGVEVKPEYVAVVLERWQAQTGGNPQLLI